MSVEEAKVLARYPVSETDPGTDAFEKQIPCRGWTAGGIAEPECAGVVSNQPGSAVENRAIFTFFSTVISTNADSIVAGQLLIEELQLRQLCFLNTEYVWICGEQYLSQRPLSP